MAGHEPRVAFRRYEANLAEGCTQACEQQITRLDRVSPQLVCLVLRDMIQIVEPKAIGPDIPNVQNRSPVVNEFRLMKLCTKRSDLDWVFAIASECPNCMPFALEKSLKDARRLSSRKRLGLDRKSTRLN